MARFFSLVFGSSFGIYIKEVKQTNKIEAVIHKSRVFLFDGKNSLFSEYKYAKIPVNLGFLMSKS
ncbi:hypothetical protein R7V75_02710 [Mesomycoplasma ovipneumoniae]|uniref:Uncharacterized protein n=1 Tax=Mesomycoplasma ovipneumoniae TaxID=29562 RepID=A0ABU4GV22_9BACT|nr:hypothetical protein [Mesomycoplasma ovipneumoniae]MDW2892317.1 hypothetical protein [Mesomycoplasma ovipneumoniae]MDW2908625.1 hypothetical protein [Mesomycoplasma ovipneumoniae]